MAPTVDRNRPHDLLIFQNNLVVNFDSASSILDYQLSPMAGPSQCQRD